MCQTCLLLDSKASEMLVGTHADVLDHPAIFLGREFMALHQHALHTHTWIGFEHARGFLAYKA